MVSVFIHLELIISVMLFLCVTGLSCALVKDSTFAAPAAPAAKNGPLLSAQHRGADPAHVHVRPAGPLDGLHLVHHWKEGDGQQGEHHLGYW